MNTKTTKQHYYCLWKSLIIGLFTSLIFLTGCKSVDTVKEVPLDWKPEKIYTIDQKKIDTALYRIISFDGGGIKGALTVKILLMLTQSVPGLLEHINLYAGTSTGGIISLGLAYGKTPSEILNLYLKNGNRIFTQYPVIFGRGVTRPLYTNTELKELYKEQFPGDKQLGDLKTKVVVPTFILDMNDMWSPVYLHNFINSPYKNELVVDAALKTGAAPVYFPAYQSHIDGGVFANNPSLIALSMAIDTGEGSTNVDYSFHSNNKNTLDNVRILSLGTGFTKTAIKQEKKDWGAGQWLNPFGKPATPLLSILMDGVTQTDDYQCGMILKEKYKRFDVELDNSYGMDDWQHVYNLVKKAEDYVENHKDEWEALVNWVIKDFLGIKEL